jgi:hypothetical protein
MLDIVPLVADGQAAPSLDELAKRVSDAHAGVIDAAFNAVMRAINVDQALIAAKELTLHGQWCKFLASCDVGERQAERYMGLARLAGANPTCKSDLADLTIDTAIKQLSPSIPRKAASRGRLATKTAIAHTRAADIIAAWAPSDGTEIGSCVSAQAKALSRA